MADLVVVADVSVEEPDDIVEDDVSLLLVLLDVLGVDEYEPLVVPLAPIVDVLLLLVLAVGLDVEVELDVLGVVLEFDVLAFAPPWPPAEAPVPAEAPAPADAPALPPPAAPPAPDWATATPPIARAAVATSVVRIFLDMSWTP